jgi:metal-dependent amidase/aminoacylase/carboxypeptidase family protein
MRRLRRRAAPQAAPIIKEELDRMGIPWQAAGEHRVVATIVGRHERAMVALRADMDALPLQEKSDHLTYRSAIPGVMQRAGTTGMSQCCSRQRRSSCSFATT